MAEVDIFGTTLVLFITVMVALVVLLVSVGMARSRVKKGGIVTSIEEESLADRAYNSLITSEAIARELMEKGVESVQASELLIEAREAYLAGRHRDAQVLAQEARAALIQVSSQMETISSDHEDIPIVEVEEIPESKPVLGKQYPKNYLQAKFLLNVVRDSLKGKRSSKPEIRRARELMQEAKQAFDEERYSEALSLAISCNRLLEGQEVVESPKQPRCPECGALIVEGDAYCGKCGQRLVTVFRCPQCEAEVEEEDNFCRKCGSALRAAEEPPQP